MILYLAESEMAQVDADLCHPGLADNLEYGCTLVSQCECGRVAPLRFDGRTSPWVDCVCGRRFNANYCQIGTLKNAAYDGTTAYLKLLGIGV